MPFYKKAPLILSCLMIAIARGDFHDGFDPWFKLSSKSHFSAPISLKSRYSDSIPAFTKKIPSEDKTFKKFIGPHFTFIDKYSPKFKEMIINSGTPYCQEIASKKEKIDNNQKKMMCYRCKDPKKGSYFEQCTYSSRPHGFRKTRSNLSTEKIIDNLNSPQDSSSSSTNAKEIRKSQSLGDELNKMGLYVQVPIEFEKHPEYCEKSKTGSTVCVVCRNPITNIKFNRCSYVNGPPKRAYAYSKSSSFGQPHSDPHYHTEHHPKPQSAKVPEKKNDKQQKREDTVDNHDIIDDFNPEDFYHEDNDDKDEEESHYVPESSYHFPSYEEEEYSPKEGEALSSSGDCKTVKVGSEMCTICKDPKTGENSENCNYAEYPKDKIYQYSKSKSFGKPYVNDDNNNDNDDKAKPESNKQQEQAGTSGSDEDDNSDDHYNNYGEPTSLDHIRSESEKISEKVKNNGNCLKVRRDSMICDVCTDQKTGGNYEQCNYSYEPDDKVFAYSKSKSFGNPTKIPTTDDDNNDYSSNGNSGEESPSETYNSPVIYADFNNSDSKNSSRPNFGDRDTAESVKNIQVAERKI